MLDYARANDVQRSRRFAIFTVLSAVVACLTLVEAGYLERFAIGSAWKIAKNAHVQKRNAEQRLAGAEAAAQAPSRRGLTSSETAAVLDLIDQKTNRHAGIGRYHIVQGTLSDTQRATLSRMFSAAGQQIIDPDTPLASSDQTIGAVLIDDGTLKLRVDRDVPNYSAQYVDSSSFSITIAPDGSVLGTPQSTLPADKVSEARIVLANAQKEPDERGRAIIHDGILAAVVLAVEVGLTVLLAVAAVCLWRSARYGVQLHHLYAILQIPLSIGVAFCVTRLIRDSGLDLFYSFGVIPAVAGCIYPLTILIGLRSQPP